MDSRAEVQRKATVVASGKGNRPINPAVVNVIRATAAGWWGIRPDDVMVTDLNSQRTYLPEADGLGKESKLYAEAKLMYEQAYQNKIYECLSVYPGVVVGVNVEMDPDMAHESTKVTVDPQSIPLESETYSKTLESGPAPGGRPGAAPNEVAGNVARSRDGAEPEILHGRKPRTAAVDYRARTNQPQESPVRSDHGDGHGLTSQELFSTSLETAGGEDRGPRNEDAEGRHNGRRGSVIEKEITEQIKDKVVHVLPPMPVGDSPFPQVEVSSYGDLPELPLEEPSMAASTLAWFSDNWQTLGLLAVGLASLLVLRSMIRGATPATEPALAAVTPHIPHEEEEEEPEVAPIVLHRRTPTSGASLREELTSMVRDDPDAAANVSAHLDWRSRLMNTALRRAAILIASLDTASADALLDEMSPEQAALVRSAVMDLGEIHPSEQQQVMAQFVQQSPQGSSAPATGVEVDAGFGAEIRSTTDRAQPLLKPLPTTKIAPHVPSPFSTRSTRTNWLKCSRANIPRQPLLSSLILNRHGPPRC